MLSTTVLSFVLPADFQVFTTLQSEFHDAIQPKGALEKFAFDRLVNHAWNIRRVSNAEISLIEKSEGQDPLTHPATAGDARRFLNLTRQIESSYSRTYKELIDLQTHRALRDLDAERPPLADPVKIARYVQQSQANRWREVDIKWKSEDIELKQLTKMQFELDLQRANQHLAQTQAQAETFIRETPKVGRNEQCPCGSGQKYKRCCGNPLTQSQIQSATSQASVATATLASPSAA